MPSSPETRPTRARFVVLGFLCSLAFVFYLDRLCIGQAGPFMQEELGISERGWGFITAAFTLAYGLFEIPTGGLGDRYGSRKVLTRIVLWWSAFTALTGCILKFSWDSGYHIPLPFKVPEVGYAIPLVFNSFLLLIVVRFLFGAGEAGAFPNAAKVISRWYPPHTRGSVHGTLVASSLIGGAFAPMGSAYLIDSIGWHATFIIFGAVGIVWAIPFYRWYRDNPAEHHSVNAQELAIIQQGGVDNVAGGASHPPIPWRYVFKSLNVWLLGFIQTCSAFNSYLIFFWFSNYLVKAREIENIESAKMTSLILGASAVGSLCGGQLLDRIIRLTGNTKWTRKLTGGIAHTSAALFLTIGIYSDTPWGMTCAFACASLCSHLQQPNWWSSVSEISGKHLGALFGLMNSMGVPGASLSTIFLGWFVDFRTELGYKGRDRWDPAFFVYALVFILGACAWMLVDTTKPIVPEDEKL